MMPSTATPQRAAQRRRSSLSLSLPAATGSPGGGGAASDNSDTSDGHRGAHLLHGLQYSQHPMKFEAGEGSSWMSAAAARPAAGVHSVHQLPVFALWND